MPVEERKEALAPFGWWIDSVLGGDWLLTELVELLESGVVVDASVVLDPLSELAASEPALALRALELVSRGAAHDWVLRAHEDEIRVVLQAALANGNALLVERATSLIHQLGREGLGRLGTLIPRPSEPPAAVSPARPEG
jgi:hypothetical protein